MTICSTCISDAYAADIVRRHFATNQVIALAVAMAETGGSLDTYAHNTSGEDSRGLWQINVASGANPQYASWDLYDPEVCAQAAWEISSGGAWWCPWSVYEESCGPGHTGSYRLFLDRARAALNLPPPPHDHYGATDLRVASGWTGECVLQTEFSWDRGGPDLSSQRLDLWPVRSYSLSPSQNTMLVTGLSALASYRWQIVSFFNDNPALFSYQQDFSTPALPSWCHLPPPGPSSNIAMLLAAGITGVAVILALTPRKKKILVKKR